MKRILKSIILSVTLFFFLSSNGCDEFNSLLLNIPMTWEFNMSGDNLSDGETVCLDQEELFQSYLENINSISLLRVILRFEDVVPADLTGDINVMVQNSLGFTFFNKTIPLVPGTYQIPNDPYEIVLTSDELQVINDYINQQNDLCFTGTISATNVTPDPPQGGYVLTGYVDFLFEADAEF